MLHAEHLHIQRALHIPFHSRTGLLTSFSLVVQTSAHPQVALLKVFIEGASPQAGAALSRGPCESEVAISHCHSHLRPTFDQLSVGCKALSAALPSGPELPHSEASSCVTWDNRVHFPVPSLPPGPRTAADGTCSPPRPRRSHTRGALLPGSSQW